MFGLGRGQREHVKREGFRKRKMDRSGIRSKGEG